MQLSVCAAARVPPLLRRTAPSRPRSAAASPLPARTAGRVGGANWGRRVAGGLPPLAARRSEEESEEESEEDEVYTDLDEDDDEDYEEYYDDEHGNEQDTSMRLYLDSGNILEWRKWAATGLFYGFTTNPTILKRDQVQCTVASLRRLAEEAFSMQAEELQLQAWGRSAPELYACGLDLAELDDRVVVKVPMTLEGIKAATQLENDGVPVTLTGVYAPHQVVTALAVGASYAAPYLGRMNDAGKDGVAEIAMMQSIIDLTGSDRTDMRLLVASLRDARELAVLAAEGCNTFTISPAVAQQMFDEKLTNDAAEVFQKDAEEMGGSSLP